MKRRMKRVRVEDVAKAMNVSPWFVRRGLQQGVFSWGYAVMTSSKYSYWINPEKFKEETGLEVTVC